MAHAFLPSPYHNPLLGIGQVDGDPLATTNLPDFRTMRTNLPEPQICQTSKQLQLRSYPTNRHTGIGNPSPSAAIHDNNVSPQRSLMQLTRPPPSVRASVAHVRTKQADKVQQVSCNGRQCKFTKQGVPCGTVSGVVAAACRSSWTPVATGLGGVAIRTHWPSGSVESGGSKSGSHSSHTSNSPLASINGGSHAARSLAHRQPRHAWTHHHGTWRASTAHAGGASPAH